MPEDYNTICKDITEYLLEKKQHKLKDIWNFINKYHESEDRHRAYKIFNNLLDSGIFLSNKDGYYNTLL